MGSRGKALVTFPLLLRRRSVTFQQSLAKEVRHPLQSGRNRVAREASDTLGGHIRRAGEASVPSHSKKMVQKREDGRLSSFYSATKLTLGCPY